MFDRDRECGSKHGYLTKAQAKQVARSMTRRHREPLHLYTCSWCGLFHVGHDRSRSLRVAPDMRDLSPSRQRIAAVWAV